MLSYKKNKTLLIVLLLSFTLLFIAGCTESAKVVNVNYEKNYKVPVSRQIPFEMTIQNTGNKECTIYTVSIDGFWGSLPYDGNIAFPNKNVQESIKPGEQKKYVLIGYVSNQDIPTDNNPLVVKQFRACMSGCNGNECMENIVNLEK